MSKVNKSRHVGRIRRKLLVNIARTLAFQGDPDKVSNAILTAFILEKKPEIKSRGVTPRHHIGPILEWFEKNDRQAIKSPRREKKHDGQRKPSVLTKDAFYRSWEWRTVRMQAIQKYGTACQCCGARPGQTAMSGEPVRICVDHIQPISTHWHLRLDAENLQILCDECNQGKGAWSRADFRPDREPSTDGVSPLILQQLGLLN